MNDNPTTPDVPTPSEPPPSELDRRLTDEESRTLADLRRQGNDVIFQIGHHEVQKARLLGRLQQIEAEAQGVLDQVGQRLGIPDGTAWTVLPDGSVQVLPGGGPQAS